MGEERTKKNNMKNDENTKTDFKKKRYSVRSIPLIFHHTPLLKPSTKHIKMNTTKTFHTFTSPGYSNYTTTNLIIMALKKKKNFPPFLGCHDCDE